MVIQGFGMLWSLIACLALVYPACLKHYVLGTDITNGMGEGIYMLTMIVFLGGSSLVTCGAAAVGIGRLWTRSQWVQYGAQVAIALGVPYLLWVLLNRIVRAPVFVPIGIAAIILWLSLTAAFLWVSFRLAYPPEVNVRQWMLSLVWTIGASVIISALLRKTWVGALLSNMG
jgi:hypothetical protein